MSGRSWLAWGVCAITLLVLLTVAVAPRHDAVQVSITVVMALIPTGCAVVLLRAATPGRVPVLLAAAGAVAAIELLLPVGPVMDGWWMLLFGSMAVVLLTVPDGRLTWRWVAWLLGAVVVCFQGLAVAVVSYRSPVLDALAVALLAGLLVCLAVSAAAPIRRYRQGSERDRIAIRWVMLAGVILPLTLLLCWLGYLLFAGPELAGIGLVLAYVAIPVAVTTGLVRPEVFDAERVTVVVISLLLLGAAALLILTTVSLFVGRSVREWTAWGAAGCVGVITAVAVLAFPWLAERVEARLYPGRAGALREVSQFVHDVEAGVLEPEDVSDALRRGLGDPGAVVAYLRPDGCYTCLGGGALNDPSRQVPVSFGGAEIGLLEGSGQRPLPAAVPTMIAPILSAVRIRSQLRIALAEVELARSKLLSTKHAERLRLERDLHDGAQQRLVALGMRLRALQQVGTLPTPVSNEIDGAVAELRTALSELRSIAHGVRPSALVAGLAPALRELSSSMPAGTIEVDCDTIDVTQEVALVAFYLAREAVTNALRHAACGKIRVQVEVTAGWLTLRVTDDGVGGATGEVLAGPRERIVGLGGDLRVQSTRGMGTSVEARVPCES